MQFTLIDPQNEQIESLQLRMIYTEPLEILDWEGNGPGSPISAPLAESELSGQRQNHPRPNTAHTPDSENNLSLNALGHSDVCQNRHGTRDSNESNVCEVPKKQTTDQALIRFASAGGPDLTDLRSYHQPSTNYDEDVEGENHSLMSYESLRRAPTSTQTSESTRTSAYDTRFQQQLADEGIHLPDEDAEKPDNLNDLKRLLRLPREHLSDSKSAEEFKVFRKKITHAVTEMDVVRIVFPLVEGDNYIRGLSNIGFKHLAPLTAQKLVICKPDYYEGCDPSDIKKDVREQCERYIVPCVDKNVPCVPNFFLEYKGPEGNHATVRLQACYDGALGARAIQMLRNYVNSDTALDGNAYTITATLQGGLGSAFLTLYSVHPTKSSREEGNVSYTMTQLGAYALTGDLETFEAGRTAIRNAREWAQEVRDNLINAANNKMASQAQAAV